MTDNVIISIKGKQLYAEGSPDEIELVTAGVLKRDSRGGYTVSYQESELDHALIHPHLFHRAAQGFQEPADHPHPQVEDHDRYDNFHTKSDQSRYLFIWPCTRPPTGSCPSG